MDLAMHRTTLGINDRGLSFPISANADYYNLNVEPVSQNRQSFAASSPIRIQSTRCYTVKNLTSGVRYKATVQAYNEVYNGGGTATKEFTQ